MAWWEGEGGRQSEIFKWSKDGYMSWKMIWRKAGLELMSALFVFAV